MSITQLSMLIIQLSMSITQLSMLITELSMSITTESFFLKSLGHVEVEQCLVVYCVFTQIQTHVHTGLHFDAQAYAIVGQHTFNLAHGGAHEAASGPCHEADVVQHALHPVAPVGIYHLAVFGHDDMRGFVTILSHVVAAQVEGSAGQ